MARSPTFVSQKSPGSYERIVAWASDFTTDEIIDMAHTNKADWKHVYETCGKPKAQKPKSYSEARIRWANQYVDDVIHKPNPIAQRTIKAKYGADLKVGMGNYAHNKNEMELALDVDLMVSKLGRKRVSRGKKKSIKLGRIADYDAIPVKGKKGRIIPSKERQISQIVNKKKFQDNVEFVRVYVKYYDDYGNECWGSTEEMRVGPGIMGIIKAKLKKWQSEIRPGALYSWEDPTGKTISVDVANAGYWEALEFEFEIVYK